MFSSPLGESLSNHESHCKRCYRAYVLVPFRGNHYQIKKENTDESKSKVLVPFRGNHYQIDESLVERVTFGERSRPLSGESLSNPCPVRVSIYAALRGSLRRKEKNTVF